LVVLLAVVNVHTLKLLRCSSNIYKLLLELLLTLDKPCLGSYEIAKGSRINLLSTRSVKVQRRWRQDLLWHGIHLGAAVVDLIVGSKSSKARSHCALGQFLAVAKVVLIAIGAVTMVRVTVARLSILGEGRRLWCCAKPSEEMRATGPRGGSRIKLLLVGLVVVPLRAYT